MTKNTTAHISANRRRAECQCRARTSTTEASARALLTLATEGTQEPMEQREESGTCLGYALQGGGKTKVMPSAIKLALDYAEAKKRSDEIQSDLHSCCCFDVNTLVCL